MNLVRLGHYHVPSGPGDSGHCQTALVVHVWNQGTSGEMVNVKVWDGSGDESFHSSVYVAPPAEHATFHLAGDCPWLR